jgi:hypothetical protein
MLTACIDKLLESLKGEINPTARACAAETLRDVLNACFTSGKEQVDGSRIGLLCQPNEASALTITKALLSRSNECVKRRREKEAGFLKNEGLEADDKDAFR